MDIVEFLTARLDEDHADAIAARDKHVGVYAVEGDAEWRVSDSGEGIYTEPHGIVVVVGSFGFLDDETANHIARNDPARVLAGVAAKRAIVEDCAAAYENGRKFFGDDESSYNPHSRLAFRTLKRLAAPYDEHPDYNPAWAVS